MVVLRYRHGGGGVKAGEEAVQDRLLVALVGPVAVLRVYSVPYMRTVVVRILLWVREEVNEAEISILLVGGTYVRPEESGGRIRAVLRGGTRGGLDHWVGGQVEVKGVTGGRRAATGKAA